MINVKSILSSNESIIYQFKEINFCGVNISSYKCERIDHNISEKVISEYIVFDMIKNLNEFKKLGNSKEDFDSFQEEYIAPLFYKHRDDLRWNIYTIFLVSQKNNLAKEIKHLENNEDYSRKFIFSMEEFHEFISHGYLGEMNRKSNQTLKTNFVLEWEKVLSEVNLAGCIYNPIKKVSVENYIRNNKAINPVGRPLQQKTNSKLKSELNVKRIKEVNLFNFRSHCFGEKISFTASDINLFSGTNGSGKTSMCEAIEYGLTGKIKGEEPKSGSMLEVSCINNDDDEITFKSDITSIKQRELDLLWYGTTTTGNKSRLNENFSIFNYLNSNAATMYINSKTNINELLQNLIYGNETTEAKAKIDRYRKEFYDIHKRLKKERSEKRISRTKLKEKIKLMEDTISETSNFDDVYKRVGLLNEILKLDKVVRDQEIINAISKTKESVELLCEYFSAREMESNYFDINSELERLNYSIQQHERKINALREKLKQNENFKIERAKMEVKKQLLINDNIKVDESNKLLKGISKVYIESIDKMNSFINEYEKVINLQNGLVLIQNEYDEILFLNEEPKVDYTEYEHLNEDIIRIKDELRKSERNLDASIDLMNTNNEVLTSIKEYAMKYISQNSQSSKCPLCKHDFESNDKLIKAISNTEHLSERLNFEFSSMKNIEIKLEEKLKELQNNKLEIDGKIELEQKIRKLRLAYSKIVPEDDNLLPIEMYRRIQNLINEYNEQIITNKTNYNNIKEIQKTQLYIEFIQERDQNFIDYIMNRGSFTKETFKKLSEQIAELDQKILKLAGVNVELESELSFKDKKLVEKNKKEMAIKHFNIVLEYFKTLKDIEDFLKWSFDFKTLEQTYNSLYESTILTQNVQREKSLLNKLEEEKLHLDNQIERCEIAMKQFEKLSSLEENMKRFISENAQRIEKIFRLVHRPKEFADICIEDGVVSFIRESTREKTNISEVSTGQSVSLVFAITLCLHLSAENAPKVIIFDEPVANMDDMHIINLIDIIRELALNGIQIFITTANNQVANYIRRKFSFFEKSFKHVKFVRNDGNLADISEILYSPSKEAPIMFRKLS